MGLRVREIIGIAANRFQEEGCLDPKLDAELLMMHLMKAERSWLFTHGSGFLSGRVCEGYFRLG